MENVKCKNENCNANAIGVSADKNSAFDVAELNKIAGILEALSWTAPDPYGEMLIDLASRLSKAVHGEKMSMYA